MARAALALVMLAAAARAQDRFEIQVYDADTAPAAAPGVEVHVNYVADPAAARALHVTVEPHLGLASWCEAGFYLQTATARDGVVDFAGWKGRFKARVPRRLGGLVGVAANVELSILPARYDPSVYGAELRPIVDLRWRRLYLSVNPILDFALAGEGAGVPHFEPAAKAAVAVGGGVALGAEWYAAFGDEPAQRLFGVIDFARDLGDGTELSLQLGAGRDFAGDERWIVKSIIGVGR